MLKQQEKETQRVWLALILGIGFVLRLVLATATTGYPYDVSCFFAWGARMVDNGASAFYAPDYFCDYPPAYLYVLGFVWRVVSALGIGYEDKLAQAVLVFVPALADIGLAFGTFYIAKRAKQNALALRLAAFVVFCPMFWYDCAVWKQIDSVLALLMVGCFYLLSQKQYLLGAVLYGLGLAVKPQALILGPILAFCFLCPVFFAQDVKSLWRAVREGALGVLCALAPLYLAAMPFFGFGNTSVGLWNTYTETATSYPYASVNAFNFIAACGGNWVGQAELFTVTLFGNPVPLFFTWEQFGNVAILAVTLFVALLAVKAQKVQLAQKAVQNESVQATVFSPLLLSAVYMIAIFTFGHRMHERYLLLGVALLLGAVAQLGNRRLLSLSAGFSLTALLNMAVVYTVVDTDDNFLQSATSTLTMRLVGLVETAFCVWLCYEAWKICTGVSRAHLAFETAEQSKEVQATSPLATGAVPFTPNAQPKWSKQEKGFVLGLTVLVGIVSFAYLGDFTAPQDPLNARDTTYTETVTMLEGEVSELWVYAGVVQDYANLTVTNAVGEEVLNVELPIGSLFQWQSYPISASEQYQIRLSNTEIMELAFKDANGELVMCFGQAETSALFNEQLLVPDTANQLNSFYFDEIYHARTAYEGLHGLPIYEISHPPMGKNFISLGILMFGMTGFGWRFAGTLFGVLLVPVIYWMTRRLTRSPMASGLVAILLSVDFMRFTQSRIATIDTISAFFILLSATCMVWYCQSVLEKGVRASVLPMALSGIAFGFGAASKWTGLYSGVGLAICYFGVIVVRYLQHAHQEGYASTLWSGNAMRAVQKGTDFGKEVVLAFAGGVLFFVCLPLMIYVASYLPYQLADANFGLAGVLGNQEYMYWYHSSLEATHPFSSAWYSWFLDLRPVWYYMGSGLQEGTHASIAGFYNPIVCWVGIMAWLRLVLRAIQGKNQFIHNALIVLLLSQLLPWLLVTRCTFLYHYYPSFLFTVVAIGLWFKDILAKEKPRALALGSGLITLSLFFFIWFYPILSGLPVGTLWAKTLQFLPSYGFYIF